VGQIGPGEARPGQVMSPCIYVPGPLRALLSSDSSLAYRIKYLILRFNLL